MTEPTSSVLVATSVTTGLTLLGISTGIQPDLLMAGMAGCLWSQTMQEPITLGVRSFNTVVASLVSAYLTPAVVGVCMYLALKTGIEAEYLPQSYLGYLVAVVIGLLVHSKLLGPAVLKLAGAKLDSITKEIK